MNILMTAMLLFLPILGIIFQYYLIRKNKNLLWLLPSVGLLATFWIGLASVLYAFFLILFTKVLTATDPHQNG